jgi:hypothetical protein
MAITGSEKVMVAYKMARLASNFFENTIVRGGLGSHTSMPGIRKFGEFNNTLFNRLEKFVKKFKNKHHREPTFEENLQLDFTYNDLLLFHVLLGNVISLPGSIKREEIATHCDVREYFINLIEQTEEKLKSSSSSTSTTVSSSSSSVSTPPTTVTVTDENTSVPTSSSSSSSSSSTASIAVVDDSDADDV